MTADSSAMSRIASDLCRDYLRAMEARDIERARAMLFPGSAHFATLEELIAWAKPRYRWCKKRFERFDECPAAGSPTR
jgi:hypothetical protein